MDDTRQTKRITRYLLGQLTDQERDRWEDEFTESDSLMLDVREVETELFDQYASGRMDQGLQRQFAERYLQSAGGRSRLAFAQALQAQLAASASARDVAEDVPAKASPTFAWSDLLRYVFPLGATAAAAILLAAYLHQQTTLTDQARQIEELKASIVSSTDKVRALEGETTGLRQQIVQLTENPPGPGDAPVRLASVNLSMAGVVLGAGDEQKETRDVPRKFLSLALEVGLPAVRPNAQIDGQLESGGISLSRPGLKVASGPHGPRVQLTFKAEEIAPFLDKPIRLTLTDRGHAQIGVISLTLRPR